MPENPYSGILPFLEIHTLNFTKFRVDWTKIVYFLLMVNFWTCLIFFTHTFSEDKKQPLVALPMSKKREMLTMSSKSMARTQFHSPADYIQYLSNSELSLQKKYSCIESLRVALTNNSLDWVQEFGTKGLKQVLSLLNECFRK